MFIQCIKVWSNDIIKNCITKCKNIKYKKYRSTKNLYQEIKCVFYMSTVIFLEECSKMEVYCVLHATGIT